MPSPKLKIVKPQPVNPFEEESAEYGPFKNLLARMQASESKWKKFIAWFKTLEPRGKVTLFQWTAEAIKEEQSIISAWMLRDLVLELPLGLAQPLAVFLHKHTSPKLQPEELEVIVALGLVAELSANFNAMSTWARCD